MSTPEALNPAEISRAGIVHSGHLLHIADRLGLPVSKVYSGSTADQPQTAGTT